MSETSGLRVLLHMCCAPCSTHVIEVLKQEHDIVLFFANSNIAPYEEYQKRLSEAHKIAAMHSLPLVEDRYDHEAWLAAVSGWEQEPEKGRRCTACFRFNLSRAAAYADGHGFDAFTTTLTVSPQKRSADIFAVGEALGAFLRVDFKKQDGFRQSVALSRQQGLYRQNYCGCEFSKR